MYRLYGNKSVISKKLFSFLGISVIMSQLVVSAIFSFIALVPPTAALTNYTEFPFTPAELTSWSTDRSTPSGGFQSTSFASRENVLEMTIDNTNGNTNPSTFYNTEGLKKDIQDSEAIKADLYVDDSWLSKDVRVGLWGVGRDATNTISNYPILEFTTIGEGGHIGWRAWDGYNGGWTNLSNSYDNNAWNTLELKLNEQTGFFDYYINNELVKSYGGFTTTTIGEVIFNNYNFKTNAADDYKVRWSEFGIGQETADPQTIETSKVFGDTYSGSSNPGWLFNRDVSTSTPFEFNTEEKVIGNGSLYVSPITNTGNGNSDKFIGEFFNYTEIEEINSFSYDFKIGAGGDSTDDNEFYLNVYANFGETAVGNYYDCKYDVVPSSGSTTEWTTVTFNPTLSYPVTKRATSPYNCPSVPAEMNLSSINSRIRMFALNLGDTSANDQGLDGYFDNVVVKTRSTSTVYDFEADVSGPAVVFTAPEQNGIVGNTDISFEITDETNISQYSFNITGPNGWSTKKWTPNTKTVSVSGLNLCDEDRLNACNENTLVSGVYKVRVAAYDSSGNRNISSSVTFILDKDAPTIVITDPASGSRVKNVLVDAEVSDQKLSFFNIELRNLNDSNWNFTTQKQYASTGQTTVSLIDFDLLNAAYYGTCNGEPCVNWAGGELPSGEYKIRINAYDEFGNREIASHNFILDKERPTASFIKPLGETYGSSVDVDFQLEDVYGLNNLVVNIYNDSNVLLGTCGSANAAGALSYLLECTIDTTSYDEGIYTLKGGGFDLAGNNRTITTTFVLDKTAPNVGFEGLTTTDTTPELLGDADDATILAVNIEGGSTGYVASLTSGIWKINVVLPLAVGTYDVSITSTDAFGNSSVKNFADSLIIQPTLSIIVPTVLGASTGSDISSPSRAQNNQSAQNGIGGNPSVQTTSSIGSSNEDSSTEADKEDDRPQVLQSTTDGADSNNSTITDDDNQCYEIFGLCWYWWIPVAGTTIGVIYFATRKEES